MTKSASCPSPLSFYVVSSFQVVPPNSRVLPKGFAFNSLSSFSEGTLYRFFMLLFLFDLRMFFSEVLACLPIHVYDTCDEQAANHTCQIEEIIADHNHFILKGSPCFRPAKIPLYMRSAKSVFPNRIFSSVVLTNRTCRRTPYPPRL